MTLDEQNYSTKSIKTAQETSGNNALKNWLAPDTDELYQAALYHQAISMLGQGYSVIPVWGDLRPANAKAPPHEWKQYQRERATTAHAKSWFIDQGYGGLALVCGDISKIAALDLDQPAVYAALHAALPELTNTRTIDTPGDGKHLLYHLPDYTSDLINGVIELRGNGCYVVAYPTRIDGREYRITNAAEILTLTSAQLISLRAFIGQYRSQEPVDSNKHLLEPKPAPASGDGSELVTMFTAMLTTTTRNPALYQTSRAAVRAGYTQQQTERALLPTFVQAAPLTRHKRETAAQRRAEGIDTIASAYSRPLKAASINAGLPNAIRETLMQAGQDSAARFLDAMAAAEIQPRQEWSIAEAAAAVKPFGIGLRLVNTAVKWLSGNCLQLCQANSRTQEGSTYYVCRGDKSANNSKRGRPTPKYYLPDYPAICGEQGVSPLGDALDPATLKTATAYRAALNKGLLERSPGQYAKKTLARRVGVTTRTIHRYTSQDSTIQTTAMFDRQPISHATIERIPDDDNRQPGQWLETGETHSNGKPRRHIATRWKALQLLSEGRTVELVTQRANHYAVIEAQKTGEIQANPAPQVVEAILPPEMREIAEIIIQPARVQRGIAPPGFENPKGIDHATDD